MRLTRSSSVNFVSSPGRSACCFAVANSELGARLDDAASRVWAMRGRGDGRAARKGPTAWWYDVPGPGASRLSPLAARGATTSARPPALAAWDAHADDALDGMSLSWWTPASAPAPALAQHGISLTESLALLQWSAGALSRCPSQHDNPKCCGHSTRQQEAPPAHTRPHSLQRFTRSAQLPWPPQRTSVSSLATSGSFGRGKTSYAASVRARRPQTVPPVRLRPAEEFRCLWDRRLG